MCEVGDGRNTVEGVAYSGACMYCTVRVFELNGGRKWSCVCSVLVGLFVVRRP